MNEKRRQIIEKLLEKINSGEVVTGDRLLPERQLAEAVGETRPVVREGLIALEAMGVLDIRDRQGIYLSSSEENEAKMMLHKVRGWPADMLSRVMEVRQIIEPLATAIAAVRLVEEPGEAAARESLIWNTTFHTVIVESAENAYLSRIYEGIHTVIEHSLSLMRIGTAPEKEGGPRSVYHDHLRLFERIEARDSAGAELCAEEHLRHSINAMVALGQIVPASNLFGQKLIGQARLL